MRRSSLRKVVAQWAPLRHTLNAILMYIAGVQPHCLGCLECTTVMVGWLRFWFPPRRGLDYSTATNCREGSQILQIKLAEMHLRNRQRRVAELQLRNLYSEVAEMQLRMQQLFWPSAFLWRGIRNSISEDNCHSATHECQQRCRKSNSNIKSYHRKVPWRDWSPLLAAESSCSGETCFENSKEKSCKCKIEVELLQLNSEAST